MYENSIISDRDRLIRENIALVNRVVNYLKPRTPPHIDKDDMLQVGTLGLISAADSYNADLGIKFSDFARQRIKGAILDEVRKMSDISRLAIRKLQDHARAIQTLSSNLNRQPTNREIADFLNISLDEFESQRTHADRFKIESLEQGEELDIFDHFSSSSPNPLEEASKDELKMILIIL